MFAHVVLPNFLPSFISVVFSRHPYFPPSFQVSQSILYSFSLPPLFLTAFCSLQYLSSPTRDQTYPSSSPLPQVKLWSPNH